MYISIFEQNITNMSHNLLKGKKGIIFGALDENSIDQSLLANEKEIYKAELDKVDKKDDIKRNIMEGKIKKFISDNTLLNQPYIKDSSLTLKKILKDNNILSYTRYQLGEGIEKKQEAFADEVYSQIK